MTDKVIDTHSGSTTMGLDFEKVSATVSLVEDPQGNLFLQGSYNGTGVENVSGPFGPVGPITGNTSGSKDVGAGVTLYTTVSNFNETSTSVSLDLTVYLQGDGMGPDYLFDNQVFSGSR